MLLQVIRDARFDLDLEPENDPAESLFDGIEHRTELREKADIENEEIKRLSGRLESARAALAEKKQALRDMEQRVEQVAWKPEKAPEPSQKDASKGLGQEIAGQPDRGRHCDGSVTR